jgi:hypothetical protein
MLQRVPSSCGCCADKYHGVSVKTSIGQRLLCYMWLGETVQVVDDKWHDKNDGIPRTLTKDDLENDAIHAVASDSKKDAILTRTNSLTEEHQLAEWIQDKLDELREGSWTIQPGPHSYMQTTSRLMQTGLAPSENAAKAAVNAKLEEAQAATDVKVDAVSEKVERVAAEVGRVVLDVADLKTLMAQLVEQTKPPR